MDVVALLSALGAIAAAIFTYFLHRDGARTAASAEASEIHAKRSADAAEASAASAAAMHAIEAERLLASQEPSLRASIEEVGEGGRLRLKLRLEAGDDLDSVSVRWTNEGGVMSFEGSAIVVVDGDGLPTATWPQGLRLGQTGAWFCSARDQRFPPLEVIVSSVSGDREWRRIISVDPPEPWSGAVFV